MDIQRGKKKVLFTVSTECNDKSIECFLEAPLPQTFANLSIFTPLSSQNIKEIKCSVSSSIPLIAPLLYDKVLTTDTEINSSFCRYIVY